MIEPLPVDAKLPEVIRRFNLLADALTEAGEDIVALERWRAKDERTVQLLNDRNPVDRADGT